MNAGGVSFDDGNASGAGISFDSGYQSADTGDGTDGFTQDGSAISGSHESGILQMADAQGISGNENGTNAGGHIGIINTHSRIRLQYGKQYGIRIESREGDGTTVIISVPVEEK